MNAVIFDMDGVLVDSERVVWESFRYAGERTGIPNVERMAIIGLGLNDEAWIKRFRQEFGADSDRILEHEEAYLQNFYANGAAPAKKGAQRLLEQLCAWNIPIAVASSSPAAVVRGRLERVGLLQYFTAVISGDMVGRSKPEPDSPRSASAPETRWRYWPKAATHGSFPNWGCSTPGRSACPCR